MVLGDSAFGTNNVIPAYLDEQVEFSLTLSRNRRVTIAIEAIDHDAFTPLHYTGTVKYPDTLALISHALVASTPYTLTVPPMAALPPGWCCAGSRTPSYPDALFSV